MAFFNHPDATNEEIQMMFTEIRNELKQQLEAIKKIKDINREILESINQLRS